MTQFAFASLGLLALAACQQSAPTPAEGEPATPTATASVAPLPSATPAPAGPDHLTLAPIAAGDAAVIADSMDNVGGCEFIGTDKRTLLSVGLPDSSTARGFGVARAGGVVVQAQTREGGRAAIEAGPSLAFEGIVLDVAHGGGAGEKVGIETSAWPATLTVSDADGASKDYEGRWACGV